MTERTGNLRSKRVSGRNILGEIALRLSDQQLRMLKIENDQTPTVPIYTDVENDPPISAVEGQVALSMADLKVWWFSNQEWHTCDSCYDRLGLPEQLTTKGGYLDELPADQPPGGWTKNHDSRDVILHQGIPWVAWTTVHTEDSSPFSQRFYGPYAAYWTGSAWALAGDTMEPMFEWNRTTYPQYELLGAGLIENAPYNTVIERTYAHIRSDGTNVYVVYYALVRHSDNGDTGSEDWGTYQVRARRWTGSTWTLLGTIDSRLENNSGPGISGDQDNSMGHLWSAAGPEAVGRVFVVYGEGGTEEDDQPSTPYQASTKAAEFLASGGVNVEDVLAGGSCDYALNSVDVAVADGYGLVAYVYGLDNGTCFLHKIGTGQIAAIPASAFNSSTVLDANSLCLQFHKHVSLSSPAYNEPDTTEPVNYLMVNGDGGVGAAQVQIVRLPFSDPSDVQDIVPGDPFFSSFGGSDDAWQTIVEDRNIWAITDTPQDLVKFSHFSRAECVRPFWDTADSSTAPDVVTMIALYQEEFWFRTQTTISGQGKIQVKALPIRRCVTACPTTQIFQSPFSSQTTFDSNETTYWSASTGSWSRGPNRVKFYIDGTLMYTNNSDAPSQTLFYYLDISGSEGPYNVNFAEFSLGQHIFKATAEWDAPWNITRSVSHTITVVP